MKLARTVILGATSTGLALAAFLIAAELILWFFPVYDGLRTLPVSTTKPVMQFEPDRTFVWSYGWDFKGVTSGRVNNAGFVNDQDYHPSVSDGILAVVGDSFIEAAMVPHSGTLQGRLQNIVQRQNHVYSFAAAGAPLSQYLVWIKHAREVYAPRGYLIVVVGNDFDESMMKYKKSPGFHYYVEMNGDLVSTLVPYSPSFIRQIARNSALARYLVFHLQIGHSAERIMSWLYDSRSVAVSGKMDQDVAVPNPALDLEFFGNTSATYPRERMESSKRAVNAFFRDLPLASGLPAGRTLFIVDALRREIYDPMLREASQQSFFARIRAYFIAQARSHGYQVVDLQLPMKHAYRQTGQRMEFPYNHHWSAVGHGVAAEAVQRSGFLERIFSDTLCEARSSDAVALEGCSTVIRRTVPP
jgi:hypothetical protein